MKMVPSRAVKAVFLVTAICSGGCVSAEPEVLAVLGPTVEIPFVADYLATLKASEQLLETMSPLPNLSMISFPVVSRSLRPGRMESGQMLNVDSIVTSALAIVGQDSFSRDWLDANIVFLETSGIPIVVANVESRATFDRIRSRYPNLNITALEIDALATALRINVYPAVITSEGIYQ